MRPFVIRAGGVPARVLLLLWAVLMLIPALGSARVVRMEITSREVVPGSLEQSPSGPYEVIKGVIYLEVNPEDPANTQIVDLSLAPRNGRGNVEFSSEFELHKPLRAGLGNHRLLYFVNNRGFKMGEEHFNYGAGKNWLYSRGWSYLWCGWNCDVPEDDRKPNITVPVVTENGKPITGRIYAEICSNADQVTYSHPFFWGGSDPYPVADMDNSSAGLTKQQYRWEEPVEVPRDRWSFARLEDGKVVPDPRHLYIEEGFTPGWLYDLVYVGKDPRVTGLGLAAIRDVVSFFRYENTDEEGTANPLAEAIEHAYAWGHSQSARLLYHFVYQDFNGDESKRVVFDGIIGNCGGAGKGLFNSRFAQTTRHGSHHEDNLYPIDFFPFTTVEQYDPVTGKRGDALAAARMSGFLPKIFFINSSTDYWTRAASLLHTDVEGKEDAGIDPRVRMYFVAGRAHTDGRIGIVGRALLVALDEWVSRGIEPPESEIPTIGDGSLVTLAAVGSAFPGIPGMRLPESYYHPYRLDLGPRWETQGIADNAPPEVGPRYVCLVPQVNEDGHEIAGIHLPEIAVPMATFTGWSMRSLAFSNTLRRNAGTSWPLPLMPSEREEKGDPRRSISERYPTREDYLFKVTESLLELRDRRLLLDEDLAILLDKATRQAALLGDLRHVEAVLAEQGAEACFEYITRLWEADLLHLYASDPVNSLNSKGYELMAAGRLEAALEVFKMNTMIAPDYWNVWDSLAECYYNMGELGSALEYYEKTLGLNPENPNAREMVKKIKREQTERGEGH